MSEYIRFEYSESNSTLRFTAASKIAKMSRFSTFVMILLKFVIILFFFLLPQKKSYEKVSTGAFW